MLQKDAVQPLTIVLPAFCRVPDRIDFYAVTGDVSMRGVRLRSASLPRRGEVVECRIRGIDPFEGRVVQVTPTDFTVKVGGASPGVIARQLFEAGRSQPEPKPPVRVHPRFVPRRTDVEVARSDGQSFAARILNLSASGVAVAAARYVEPDSIVTIGATLARVVRRLEGGFGAAFLQPFDHGSIGPDFVL